MKNTIAQYQKAFNNIVERLKISKKVLAVMVFGSMVTGDLWDESDIDLFVIMDSKSSDLKNIYIDEKGVPVHMKLMSKNRFQQLYEEDLRGGFIHRILASSKLVFSRDADIIAGYDMGRYFPDIDRKRWNMVYVGNLIKNVSVCKKYLSNGGIYTAYTTVVNCVEIFAKLYLNSSGYMISKDDIAMATNLNDEFKENVDKLFLRNGEMKEKIEGMINYIQYALDVSIREITSVLLNYLSEKDCFLSSEEIRKDKLFENYDIPLEDVLNKLWEKNIIKRESREYKTEDGKVLFEENVYFI